MWLNCHWRWCIQETLFVLQDIIIGLQDKEHINQLKGTHFKIFL